MSTWESFITICGLAVTTLLTRGFFLFSEREWVLPAWARRGLRYAPLAALVAVLAPEVLMTDGHLVGTWQDARLFAAAAAMAYYFWRRGLLGTIVTGMLVLVSLKFGLGW